MNVIVTDAQMKAAFRAAYDFLDQHRIVLFQPEDYQRVLDDIKKDIGKYGDNPLTVHLVMAVYDFICDMSKEQKQ